MALLHLFYKCFNHNEKTKTDLLYEWYPRKQTIFSRHKQSICFAAISEREIVIKDTSLFMDKVKSAFCLIQLFSSSKQNKTRQ